MPGWFGNRRKPRASIEPLPLSDEAAQKLELAFSPETRGEARRILEEECGRNIPGWEVVALEEMRIMAIEFSCGSVERLQHCVDVAKFDFRDFYCLTDSKEPQEMMTAAAAENETCRAVRRSRGFQAWTGPIVGPIVGMLLAAPAIWDQDRPGSILLGLGAGAVIGLIAGMVLWASNRQPK